MIRVNRIHVDRRPLAVIMEEIHLVNACPTTLELHQIVDLNVL